MSLVELCLPGLIDKEMFELIRLCAAEGQKWNVRYAAYKNFMREYGKTRFDVEGPETDHGIEVLLEK